MNELMMDEAINGMPLTADPNGLARLLDRYAEELPEHQEWREFVHNAFDAGATEVLIDGYEDPATGRRVMRISDDGHGMDESGLRDHLTRLHASGPGRSSSVQGNFGVGARIAGLSRNPLGVVYASRREGVDLCAWLRKFADGSYGLEQFPLDGEVASSTVTAPDKGMLPAFIGDHGTAVMLHGKSGRDTWLDSTPYDIAKYLQERYYEMPAPVKVRRSDGARTFDAVGVHYTKYAEETDLVVLEDGTVCEWWVFGGDTKEAPSWVRPRRGIGIVFQNETLDFAVSGTQKVARYKRFGLYGKSVLARVAILVHLPQDQHWRMNQERTDVVGPNNRRVDWDRIGREFAEVMPEPIRAMLSTGTASDDLTEEIARRLNPEWFKHVTPTLIRQPDDAGATTAASDRQPVHKRRAPTPRPPGPNPQPSTDNAPQPRSERPGISPATERWLARITQPKWLSFDEWSADPIIAASYSPVDNVVLLQQGHWIYEANTDLVAERRALPRSTVAAAVERAYGIEMAAKVTQILSMKARQITDEQYKLFLSDEALTSAACGLMAVSLMIDEQLGRWEQG